MMLSICQYLRMSWIQYLILVALVNGKSFHLKVQTTHGLVQGIRKGNSAAFLGIPYAAPPVGPFRWENPQPLEAWEPLVLDATTVPPGCIQICDDLSFVCPLETSEDCLRLNIYRPLDARTSGLLPVMVFLHGGNYKSGACSGPVYTSQILAPTIDAVVVCIEYRIGAMGFLYLEEDPETGERIPGNFGIEDQIAALKFLWQNLESFGGDPNRITLTGQSAGAESISLLLTSPNHSELFSQAILFSDPFSLPLKTPADSNALGLFLASLLECEPASLSCLRTKSVDEIASATHESLSQLINHEKAFQLFQQWGPTVTEQPITSIEAGLNALKPIILGTCGEEGRIFVYEILPEPVSTASYNMFENILVPGLSQEIQQFFPPDPNVTDQRDVLSSMVTDYLFGCPTQYMAKLLIARGETRIYHYLFDHAFSFQHVWQQYKWCYGHACHGCDVPFIFLSAILNDEEYSDEEKRFVSKYSSYLANFIHSGDPNHTGDGGQEGTDLTVWPKAGQVPGHLSTLILSANEEIRSVEDISSEKCQLFDRMGYTGVSNINKKNLNL